jgi:hypothetical protein
VPALDSGRGAGSDQGCGSEVVMTFLKTMKTFFKRFLRVVLIDFVILLLGYFPFLALLTLLGTSYWITVYYQLVVIPLSIPFIVLAIAALIPNLLFPSRPSLKQWVGFITLVGLILSVLAVVIALPGLEARYHEDRLEVGADTYYLSSSLDVNAVIELRSGEGFEHEYTLYRCDRLGLHCSELHVERLQEQGDVSHGKLRYNSYDHSLLLIIHDRVAAVFQLANK